MNRSEKGLTLAAHVLSYVMHPFIMPTYGAFILLFGLDIMAAIEPQFRWNLLLVIVLCTMVMPASSIVVLRLVNLIPNMSLLDRRERIVPMLIVAISYVVCLIIIPESPLFFLVRIFMYAALACVFVALIITFFWKISLHMIAAAGLLAMVVLMTISIYNELSLAMILGIILTGALASSRLYLGYHTPLQVGAGFLLGFLTTTIIVLSI